MEKRIVRRPEIGGEELPAHLHPILRRVYRARGVQSHTELDYALRHLLPSDSLRGIDAASELIASALLQRQHILIVGDFDADGATSTAVAVLGLRALGAARVSYLVPNRFAYGYGLTPEIVRVAAERRPDLLITVDNGIASIAGVALAKQLGMKVLVTDHHLAGAELPAADAIVNPNQPGDEFSSKALAGVGVMFYVLLAVRARLRNSGQFGSQSEPKLAELLDLVALGTVADVVPLDYNNRILVHQGLSRIRAGCCRPGLQALAEVAGRDLGRMVTADLGFALAPRLNAAGRLTDMSLGIECLLTDDPATARALALQLHELNRQRREIESTMHAQALAITDALACDGNSSEPPCGLCLFDESWHQGVIGILASRMREHVHRPVIAFAPGSGSEVKGSARSIPGVHIRDVLEAVATANPNLLTRFGGHAMAAGVTLDRTSLQPFAAAFAEEIARRVTVEQLQGVIYSDGALGPDDISVALAEQVRHAGPWGQTFAEPIFDDAFELVSMRTVAEKHLKYMVRRLDDVAQTFEAMAFNVASKPSCTPGTNIRMAFRLDVNEYLGRRSPQLVVEHAVPLTI